MASTTLIITAIAAAAVAAAAAGAGAYMGNQAAQQQAKMRKNAAEQQAQEEQLAGEARARSIQYNADKLHKSFLSREAGAGVQVGQGSLLETETQFGYDVQLAKDFAKYPHELAGATDKYQGDLFGFEGKQLKAQQGTSIALATVGSAAGSATHVSSSLASGGGTSQPFTGLEP